MTAQQDAQAAIFTAITKIAEEAGSQQNGKYAATMIREAAMAYRLAAGGPQPGGIPVSSD